MRIKNIFHRVVRNEDDYTELFSNLLDYKSFRLFFCDFIVRKNSNLKFDFEYGDITTQFTSQESGRPDIVIENDDTLILIENKVETNTRLTGNQPSGYIDLIRELGTTKSCKGLIFILPRKYIHESLIISRYEEKKNDKDDFLIIYWEDLIQEMEKTGFPQISEIFKHFIDLSNSWFPLKEVVFSNNQIDMLINGQIIETFQKLTEIVDYTHGILEKKDGIKANKKITETEYAIYIKNSENQDFFYFGIWYPFWKENNSPLCIAVETDYPEKTVTEFKRKFSSYVDMDGWLTIGLNDYLTSGENSAEKISDIVTKTIDELK